MTPAEWELVWVVPETESHGPGLGHATAFAPFAVTDATCGQAGPGECARPLPRPLTLEWWGRLLS